MNTLRILRARMLDNLDSDETLKGYLTGFDRKTCPDIASFSFKHGWRNGASDRGYRPIDDAQRELAHDVVKTGYLLND